MTFLCFAQKSFSQISKADSLLTIIKTSKEDTNKVNAIIAIYSELLYKEPVQAMQYARQALALSQKISFKKGIANANRVIGLSFYYKGEYDSARMYYNTSLAVSEETGDDNGKARTLMNIASIEQSQGRLENALSFDQQSLDLVENSGNKQLIAKLYNNIGGIHYSLNNYNKAAEYFFKSLELKKQIGDQQAISNSLDNIAELYRKMKIYNKALQFNLESLEIRKKINDQKGMADSYGYIGADYQLLDKPDQALEYLLRGLKMQEDVDNKKGIGDLCSVIGKLYIDKNNFPDALRYLLKGLDIGREMNSKEIMRDCYERLSESYAKQNNFSKAFRYNQLYIAVKDSILNEDKNKTLLEMESKYENEKKQKEIQMLNKDKEIKEAEVKSQKQQKNFFIAGFIMFLVLTLMSFNRFQIKKKANKELAKANDEISGALRNLRTTQTQLIQQEKMASLGHLTAGIAHEIQNPLNFVNNFSDLSNELADELMQNVSDEERKEIVGVLKQNLDKINYHGKRADSIVKNMLEHSRVGTGTKQLTDINRLCEEFLQLSFHGMRANYPDFTCTIDKITDPDLPRANVVSQDISRMLLNLFNNAFYAVRERAEEQRTSDENYNPEVTLITQAQNNPDKTGTVMIAIHVKDNGKGIPKKIRTKIFEPFFTTKPTGKGTGLGLSLSYDILKAHGGDIRVESEEGKGAEFIILLPVA